MKRRDEILRLRAEGKSYRQIQSITGASKGTIAYHCGEGQKEKTRDRIRKMSPLHRKYYTFIVQKNEDGTRQVLPDDADYGWVDQANFTYEELLQTLNVENPVCYLSGRPLNLDDRTDYSLDHILPVSRGGKNTIDNVALCCSLINVLKRNLTNEELIELCKNILTYNGYQVVGTGFEPVNPEGV